MDAGFNKEAFWLVNEADFVLNAKLLTVPFDFDPRVASAPRSLKVKLANFEPKYKQIPAYLQYPSRK